MGIKSDTCEAKFHLGHCQDYGQCILVTVSVFSMDYLSFVSVSVGVGRIIAQPDYSLPQGNTFLFSISV